MTSFADRRRSSPPANDSQSADLGSTATTIGTAITVEIDCIVVPMGARATVTIVARAVGLCSKVVAADSAEVAATAIS